MHISRLFKLVCIVSAPCALGVLGCALDAEGMRNGQSPATGAGGDLANASSSSASSSGGSTNTGGGGSSSSSSSGASSSSSGSGSSSSSSGAGGGGSVDCAPGSVREIQDDFESYVGSSLKWLRYKEFAVVTQSSGLLIIAPPASYSDWGGFYAKEIKSLVDCSMSVQLKQALNNNSKGAIYFRAVHSTGMDYFPNRLGMGIGNGMLQCFVLENDVPLLDQSIAYDPVKHQYWQVRESQGKIYCETSEDGNNWSEMGNVDSPAYINQLRLDIGGGSFSMGPDPGEAHFDNLNLQ